MADIVIFYQITVAILSLIGAVLSLGLIRPIKEWEWRQAGYKFAAALTIYALIELMTVTDVFYDPPWVMITSKGLFIIYMVYGIFNLRRTIQEMS